MHGGGKAEKSYIHAQDLSRAILSVIERAPLGKVYNVGPKESTSIREVVRLVSDACSVPFDSLVEEAPDRMGQDQRYLLNSSAIERDCGWQQTISLPQGIERVVQWVKKFPELLTYSTEYQHRL